MFEIVGTPQERLRPASPDLSSEISAGFEALRDERGNEPTLLYRTLLHSPSIAVPWCRLGSAIRFQSSLDDDIREAIICTVAAVTRSSYEWSVHAPLAAGAGLDEDWLRELWAAGGEGASPDAFFSALERGHLAPRLHRSVAAAIAVSQASMEDAIFEALAAEFDEQALVDVIATAAYYLGVSRFLAAFGIEGKVR